MIRLIQSIAACSALTACSVFTPPKEKPIIEDKVGDRIGTLATTAERRVVLVDLQHGSFCAEAAPDVAESVNSSIRAAAEYSAKSGAGADKTASMELARQLSTSLTTLFTRTQGVQLFRDGAYALCQARMNGDIKGEQFQTHFSALLDKAVALVRDELPQVAKKMADNAVAAAQSAASDSKLASSRAEAAAVSAKEAAQAAALATKSTVEPSGDTKK